MKMGTVLTHVLLKLEQTHHTLMILLCCAAYMLTV